MAKKKKTHRIAAAPSKPQRPARNYRPLLIAGVVIIALSLAAGFLWKRHASNKRKQEVEHALLALAKSDLTHLEPHVVEKVRSLTGDVRQNPNSDEAWGRLGMNYDVNGKKAEAVSCYKEAARLDPSEFRWPYFCAVAMQRSGDRDAQSWFEASEKIDSNYAPLQVRLGQSYFDSGNNEKASAHFQRALQLDPQNSHAYMGLAQVAILKGNLEEAKSDLVTAVSMNPKHGEAHGLLAEVYRRLRDSEQANHEMMIAQQLELGKKTVMEDPVLVPLFSEGESSYMRFERARAYIDRRDYATAARELESAISVDPDPHYLDLLGYVYQQMGRYGDAIPLHERALEKLPNNPAVLYNLVDAYFGTGKKEEAYSILQKIRSLKPKDAESYTASARYYLREENPAGAIAVLQQGRQMIPDDARILAVLGWLLSTAKQDSLRNGVEAVKIGESLRARFGNSDFGTLKVLAAAYAETGQFDKAQQAATQAYQLVSSSDPSLAQQIQAQLKFYQNHQPYRQ